MGEEGAHDGAGDLPAVVLGVPPQLAGIVAIGVVRFARSERKTTQRPSRPIALAPLHELERDEINQSATKTWIFKNM